MNLVLLSASLVAVAASAAAQTATPAGAPHTQRLEVSMGYQLLHIPDETYPFGLNFDLAARVHPMFDVVGEAGFARDVRRDPGLNGTLTFLNFGAGPRWTRRMGSYAPFAQILLGAASPGATFTQSTTGRIHDRDWAFMLQPGVGIAVPMAHAFSAVGQVDYRRVFFRETGENEFRFFAGLRVGVR